MKVAREEIVGLMTALELYTRRDHDADMRRWDGECRTIVDAVVEIPGVVAGIEQDDWLRPVPEVSIAFTSEWQGRSAKEIVDDLANGDPPIIIEASRPRRRGYFHQSTRSHAERGRVDRGASAGGVGG